MMKSTTSVVRERPAYEAAPLASQASQHAPNSDAKTYHYLGDPGSPTLGPRHIKATPPSTTTPASTAPTRPVAIAPPPFQDVVVGVGRFPKPAVMVAGMLCAATSVKEVNTLAISILVEWLQ